MFVGMQQVEQCQDGKTKGISMYSGIEESFCPKKNSCVKCRCLGNGKWSPTVGCKIGMEAGTSMEQQEDGMRSLEGRENKN